MLVKFDQKIIAGTGILLIVGLMSWYGLTGIKHQFQDNIKSNLQTILRVTHEALYDWADDRINNIIVWAADPRLQQAVTVLLNESQDRNFLLHSPALTQIRSHIEPLLNIYFDIDFFVISPDYLNIASRQNENLGITNLLAGRDDYLKRVFAGEEVLVPPIISDGPLLGTTKRPSTNEPTMFIVIPIRDDTAKVIAALAVQLNPSHDFTRIIQMARTGETGDTYAFNKSLRLISEVRFDKQLRQIGLLDADEHSILTLELRDPGGNMLEGFRSTIPRQQLPFTQMAVQAGTGDTGVNTQGYRDYRGVAVVGAWLWDNLYDFGLVIEINKDEAYHAYYLIRNTISIGLFLTILFSVCFSFVLYQNRKTALLETSKTRAINKQLLEEMAQRIEIEKKNEHTNALLGCLIDSITDLIFYKDKSGVYLGCNKAFAQSVERDKDEIIGLTDFDLFDHETAKFLRQQDNIMMKTGKHRRNEEWMKQAGSSSGILFDTLKTLYYGPDMQIFGLIGVSRDITTQFEIREALQKSRDMLNRAQQIGHVGGWEWDIRKNHFFWTDEIYRIFGLDPLLFEPTYETFMDRVLAGDRARVRKAVQQAIHEDVPFQIEHCIVLPGGVERIVSERAEVEYDTDGEPIRMIGTVEDITAFKKIELDLIKHQEHLEDLVKERTQNLQDEIEERIRAEEMLRKFSWAVEESPATVMITDHRGIIEYVNPKFVELTQYTAAEVIGQNPRMLQSGQHNKEYYQDMWDTISGGQKWFGELCDKKKDGSIFWEKAAFAPISNDNGEITHYVAVKEDITDQKRMIHELRDAKEAADQASEAKTMFLSSMSHELRTPLNTILGFAQLLESDDKQPLLPTQHHGVKQIISAGELLLQLISEILDLSNIEAGVLEISMDEINLGTSIDDIITSIKPIAQNGRVEVIFKKPNQEYYIRTDANRLKQILMNLLTNAIKYNKAGGRVIVSCTPVDDSFVQITVADDGPGIPSDKMSQVFAPFDRLGAETSSIPGTGIGLTITKRLVGLMNGQINVSSDWGKGSCFSVKLPQIKSIQQQSHPDTIETTTGDQQDSVALGKFTILYIEDNAANRQLVLFILARRKNFKLLIAENGEQGIAKACQKHPDVILLDITLPDMSGYDALERLHDLPETQHIPVVALSANATPLDIEKGLKAGFIDYLTKPVKVNALLQTLDGILTAESDA